MYNTKSVKLMIVDDSMVFGRFLKENLPKMNERIEVVGYSMNAFDAMKKISSLKPDVISPDIEMPGMNGIDFLKKLLPEHRIPVILVSSLNVSVFDALSYGAVDFVKKPDMSKGYTTEAFARSLASKLVMASTASVKVPRSILVNSSAPAATAKPEPEPARREPSSAAAPPPRVQISLPKLAAGQLKIKNPHAPKLKNTVIALAHPPAAQRRRWRFSGISPPTRPVSS